MSWYHGGPTVHGDMLLPPTTTRRQRSGGDVLDEWVYVTPQISLARCYGATARGWVYEVEPLDEPVHDPATLLEAGASMRCHAARIVRRWRISRADVERYSSLVQAFGAAL